MAILADGLSSFRPPFPRTPFSPAIYLFRWRGNNLENQHLKITVADTLAPPCRTAAMQSTTLPMKPSVMIFGRAAGGTPLSSNFLPNHQEKTDEILKGRDARNARIVRPGDIGERQII